MKTLGIERQATTIDEPTQSSKDAYIMVFVSMLNWLVAIVLPFCFLNSASKDGFPWLTHYIFGAYCVLVICYELFALYRMEGFQYYFAKLTFTFCGSAKCSFGSVLIPLNLFTGMLARTDVYTDGTFVVVAWHYRDESVLWIPALILYIFGVFLLQSFLQGLYISFQIFYHDNISVDYMQHAIAAYGQMMLLTQAIGLKGNYDHNSTFVDMGLSAIRFTCEDVSQTVIQILFLNSVTTKEGDRKLVLVSIVVAISLSFIRVVSTLIRYFSSEIQVSPAEEVRYYCC